MESVEIGRRLKRLAVEFWRIVRAVTWALLKAAELGWIVLRPVLAAALNVLAALLVLFEEWGWRPLSAALAWLGRFSPVAAVERWIASLPPYGALLAFVLPTSVLLPLKFLAVWLLANNYYVSATALFVGAKIVSTALLARIFILAKPALMQIPWFARLYDLFIPWKDALFAEIRASWPWRYGRMVKTRMVHETKQFWTRIKPDVVQRWQLVRNRIWELWYGRPVQTEPKRLGSNPVEPARREPDP